MENNLSNLVLIPEENVYVSFEVTKEKPFNVCFACASFRNGCSGPNILSMGTKRACEFFQMCRMFLRRLYPDKYSYQWCADETDLSLSTVKRLLTGKIEVPSFDTMKRLNDLLVGDADGKFPCACPLVHNNANSLVDAVQELTEVVADEETRDDAVALHKAIANIQASFAVEMEAQRSEHKAELAAIRAEHKAALKEKDNNNRKQLDSLLQQVEDQRKNIDHLRTESANKSRWISQLMESKT